MTFGLSLRVSVAAAAMFLSGCLAHQDDPIAMSSAMLPSTGDDARPKPVVITVKQIEQPSSVSVPVVGNPERIPTAAEIFDFHPPGTRTNTWRQPFVIEDHGGPLEIYRKQTAAMLKELQDPNFRQTVPRAFTTPVQSKPDSLIR